MTYAKPEVVSQSLAVHAIQGQEEKPVDLTMDSHGQLYRRDVAAYEVDE